MIEILQKILKESYEIIFVSAIIYLLNTLFSFSMKAYGYFKLKKDDITYTLTFLEKIMLWISISIFIAYLIN